MHSRLRDALVTLAVAVVATLATGLVPNQPEVSIVGAHYYGYPLYWRIEMAEMGRHSIAPGNLLVDVATLWVLAVLVLVGIRKLRASSTDRGG